MWRSNFGIPSGFRATGDGPGFFGRILRETAIALIWGYRFFISPLLPGSCRFTPTCSQYAEEAFRRHGPCLALWMSVRRLGRCHPFHPGGEDPVPRSR